MVLIKNKDIPSRQSVEITKHGMKLLSFSQIFEAILVPFASDN